MKKNQDEATYCRGPLARSINRMYGFLWYSNPNIKFPKKKGEAQATLAGQPESSQLYESGRPDALIIYDGDRVAACECKAAYYGSVDLTIWSEEQERWRRRCILERGLKVPYYVALWMAPVRKRVRLKMEDTRLYLVPAEAWIELRDEAARYGTQTVAMYPELERIYSRKTLYVDKYFSPYALTFHRVDDSARYVYGIPQHHIFWSIFNDANDEGDQPGPSVAVCSQRGPQILRPFPGCCRGEGARTEWVGQAAASQR